MTPSAFAIRPPHSLARAAVFTWVLCECRWVGRVPSLYSGHVQHDHGLFLSKRLFELPPRDVHCVRRLGGRCVYAVPHRRFLHRSLVTGAFKEDHRAGSNDSTVFSCAGVETSLKRRDE